MEEYLKKQLKTKKIKKYFKYKAYGVFGIYQYYKLTYISLITEISKRSSYLDSEIYEIKEYDQFAIQAKKFYKKQLAKKEVNTERTYKKYFRSYKFHKYFYLCYDYDLSTNIQQQRKEINLNGRRESQFHKKFTWNGDLVLFEKIFKYHEWLVPIIHGYVGSFQLDQIQGMFYPSYSQSKL